MTGAEEPGRNHTDSASIERSAEGMRASMHDPRFVRLLVDASPDVRKERVAELRQRIQLGGYDLDPARVAEGMIRNLTRPRN